MNQDDLQEATVIKNSLVNIEKRQKDILELLQQTEQLSTFELAESLDVSIITVIVLIITKTRLILINLVLKGLNKRLPEKLVNTLAIMIHCLLILARLH